MLLSALGGGRCSGWAHIHVQGEPNDALTPDRINERFAELEAMMWVAVTMPEWANWLWATIAL